MSPTSAAPLRVRGMRDLLPDEMAAFRKLEDAFRDVSSAWGYREVRTPALEYLHLFTSAGTLSPQLLDRVYSFLDWDGWSGERVVLRPDGTIPVARLFGESARDLLPARLAYVQEVYRFATGDQPRSEWQCGTELIGAGGPLADLELIAVGVETLRRCGAQAVRVRVSHAGIARALLAAAGLGRAEQVAMYDALLAGDRAAVERLGALLPGALSAAVLLDVAEAGVGYVTNLQALLGDRVPGLAEPLAELRTVVETLDRLHVDCAVTPLLARDFEYYRGVVFRFDVGEADVGGGGRYDGLLEFVGAADVPASGFAFDVPSLLAAVRIEPGGPLTVPLVVERDDPATYAAAMAAAKRLHRAGVAASVMRAPAPLPHLVVDLEDPARPFVLRSDGGAEREGDLGAALARLERLRR